MLAAVLHTALATINFSSHTERSLRVVPTNVSNYRPNEPDEQTRIKSPKSYIRVDVYQLNKKPVCCAAVCLCVFLSKHIQREGGEGHRRFF